MEYSWAPADDETSLLEISFSMGADDVFEEVCRAYDEARESEDVVGLEVVLLSRTRLKWCLCLLPWNLVCSLFVVIW